MPPVFLGDEEFGGVYPGGAGGAGAVGVVPAAGGFFEG